VAEEDIQEPGLQGEDETPGYEEAYSQVEELVRELESGELTLKESIQKYEQAVKAMNRCYELLDEAQKKIEMLTRDAEGRITSREDLGTE